MVAYFPRPGDSGFACKGLLTPAMAQPSWAITSFGISALE